MADPHGRSRRGAPEVDSLLAVDLGMRAGFALMGLDGRLRWYRSTNFGTPARMKKAAWTIASAQDDLLHIVVEGDRALADIWRKVAHKRGLRFTWTQADRWRPSVLLPRQQRSGTSAKEAADALAREIIENSDAARPTSLRHDAAEAICIGHWAVARFHPGAGAR